MKIIDETKEVEETLDEALEKEPLTVVNTNRCPEEVFLGVIKNSLCSCNECKTQFIKRKEKLSCPVCYSKDITVCEE